MKCKLFAGLFVLLPCLLGLTGSPVYRPTLLVLKSQNCGPCIDWANAYNAPNPAFRQWINDTFRMKDALMIESAKGQEVAGRYGVTRVPTFLVVDDSGRLLHSVTGFNSANELARKLIAGASVRSVRKEPIRGTRNR